MSHEEIKSMPEFKILRMILIVMGSKYIENNAIASSMDITTRHSNHYPSSVLFVYGIVLKGITTELAYQGARGVQERHMDAVRLCLGRIHHWAAQDISPHVVPISGRANGVTIRISATMMPMTTMEELDQQWV